MEALLHKFQVPPGTQHITHQAYDEANPGVGAVFIIPDDELEGVMTAIDSLVAGGGNYPLLEKQTPVIGAVFDLDFKFKCDLPDKPVLGQAFIQSHIRPFVSAINQLYREHLDVDGSIDFVVQQRTAPYQRSNKTNGEFVCDGFHIIAPALRATPQTHTALRQIGLQRGLLDKFEFPVPVLETADKWWDASVVRPNGNSWFIFGLGKMGRPNYKNIFNLRATIPVAEEGGGICYNLKAVIKFDEKNFRRQSSYAINRSKDALPVRPEMAKALLDTMPVAKVIKQVVKPPSDPGTPCASVAESVVPDGNDLIVSLNGILGLPPATP